MSLFVANCGLLARAPGGGGYDSDAEAYFTAAGITDAGMKTDANQFYLDAKADNYYNDFIAFWLLLGGSSSAHAINGKNPGTHDISWVGTVTHDSNGITPNGTTGYGNTNLTPSSHTTLNNFHMSLYCRTLSTAVDIVDSASNKVAITNLQYLQLRNSANLFRSIINSATAGGITSASNSDARGFFLASRRSNADCEIYKNGSSLATNTSGDAGLRSDQPLYLGARNNGGTAQAFSNRNYAFASVGLSMTDTKAADMYSAVQALQTARSRNV